MEMELRVNSAQLTGNQDGSLKVSGYVNKTEQLSEILGVTKRFKEKIARGAFSRAIKKAGRDIDFLSEHKADKILASTRNNSLQLTEDEQGLFMEATITPTTWGKDAYELINSGIFRNMSFGFRTIKDTWKKIESNLYERTIEELELFEVSVVKDPAYSQSTIAARSIELIDEPEIKVEEDFKEQAKERELPLNVREASIKLDIQKTEGSIRSLENMSKLSPESTGFSFVLEREKQKLKGLQLELEDIKKQAEEYRMTKQNEERELQTKAYNESIQGQTIGGPIIEKLENVSNAFAKARKIPFEGDTLKVPYETILPNAGFVPEGDYLSPATSLNLDEVAILKQKKVSASISMSKMLMHDSGADLSQHARNILTRGVAKAIETSILSGKQEVEFKGIATDPNVSSADITRNGSANQLRSVYSKVHSDFIPNSTWYMSRPYYEEVAVARDENGRYIIEHVVIDGKIVPTLFGCPVEVTEALDAGDNLDQVPVVFGSIADGYTIGVKKGFTIKDISGDTTQVLRGSAAMVGDFYGDGAVTNYNALAKGFVNIL